MPEYRRNLVPDGCFFFTANLLNRQSDLLVTRIDILRDAVRQTRSRAPFTIGAWILLPDHMHCVWTLPSGDADCPGHWRMIKAIFLKALPGLGMPSKVMVRREERGIWQRRYWEHTIRDARDYAADMDYTHFDPVKYGYAMHAVDWRYSSFSDVLQPACIRSGGSEVRASQLRQASGVERKWRNALRFSALRLLS